MKIFNNSFTNIIYLKNDQLANKTLNYNLIIIMNTENSDTKNT